MSIVVTRAIVLWDVTTGRGKGRMEPLLISSNCRWTYNDLKIKTLISKICQCLGRPHLRPSQSGLPYSPRCPTERFRWHRPGLWTWRSGLLRHPPHGWWHLWAAICHIFRPFPFRHTTIHELWGPLLQATLFPREQGWDPKTFIIETKYTERPSSY